MKSYKIKFLTLLVMVSVMISCSENTNQNNNDLNQTKSVEVDDSHQSFTNFNDNSYQEQLPYLDGSNDLNDLMVSLDFKNTINNENVSWEYFNENYNDNLNISEKQNLAYLILGKKDLLTDYLNNPSEEKLDLILKYSNVLVDSEYKGYCLLYNCLIILNGNLDNNTSVVNDLRDNILEYSADDEFHASFLASTPNEGDAISKYYQKIEQNWSFVNSIENIN